MSKNKVPTMKQAVAPKATTPAPVAQTRKRLTRQERAPAAREEIFAAAAKVVGEHGYAGATVARITTEADIAQGTFYIYFASRQALFDELLPNVGEGMLRYIGGRVSGSADVYQLEERGFRAFFEYLKLNPGFFRILNEAESAAPLAFQKYYKLLSSHYVASLRRGLESGHIRAFGLDELETLAYVFMAARDYLYVRYVKGRGRVGKLPESVVQTYMKLVRNGLR
jgi:AcrR family transcriptional regulator